MQTASDHQAIIIQLGKNDPSFVHLDFKNMPLTILKLKEIASKMQNNDFIGNVSWGEIPKLSGDLV